MSGDLGPEPRHINTLDENAEELPDGTAVPLGQPPPAPEQVAQPPNAPRRRKLMAAAFDRYRFARAMQRRTGTGDSPIEPIAPIQPIRPIRPLRDFHL